MLDLKHYPTKHTWQGKERYHITPTGKKYPGVTTILKACETKKSAGQLKKWRLKQMDLICKWLKCLSDETDFDHWYTHLLVFIQIRKFNLNFGVARGRWLHEKIEVHLDFSRPEPSLESISEEFKADYTDCELTFEQWWISVEPVLDESCNEAVLLESALWDDDLCVAGTMDALTFWDGELALCDWKTSKDYVNPNWDSIQNYFCQLAAYRKMINQVYKDDYIEVNKAVLVVAVPNKKAQVFVLELDVLQDYEAKWVRKVKKFYREREKLAA